MNRVGVGQDAAADDDDKEEDRREQGDMCKQASRDNEWMLAAIDG